MSMHTLVQRDDLVGNHFAGLASIVARQLNFNGRGLAQCILDKVVWLNSLLVNIDPLGIPAKGGVFDCGE